MARHETVLLARKMNFNLISEMGIEQAFPSSPARTKLSVNRNHRENYQDVQKIEFNHL